MSQPYNDAETGVAAGPCRTVARWWRSSRATSTSPEEDGSRRGIDAIYLRALLMSPQSAPAAVPTAPPTTAPRAGLPPTMAPTAAPPAAPIAPPLRARCCWGVMFAHPTVAHSTKTSRSARARFMSSSFLKNCILSRGAGQCRLRGLTAHSRSTICVPSQILPRALEALALDAHSPSDLKRIAIDRGFHTFDLLVNMTGYRHRRTKHSRMLGVASTNKLNNVSPATYPPGAVADASRTAGGKPLLSGITGDA
jgi:hypothetical protein